MKKFIINLLSGLTIGLFALLGAALAIGVIYLLAMLIHWVATLGGLTFVTQFETYQIFAMLMIAVILSTLFSRRK